MVTIFLQATSLDDAKDLFDNTKYEEAIKIFKTIEDNAEVQYYMGKAYLYGLGVEKNFEKAATYAKLSSQKGYPDGLNLMGVLYMQGDGLPKDELEALMYYKKAAEAGSIKAIRNLAMQYASGNVVKKDLDKAKFWYEKVIKNGYKMGYLDIASMYYREEKNREALKYYLLAIEHNEHLKQDADLWNHIGFISEKLKQYKNAYEYYRNATSLGDYSATFNLLDIVTNAKMTDKYEEAEQLTLEALKHFVNDKDAREMAEYTLYGFYFFTLRDYNKLLSILIPAYKNGNLNLGCELANYYGSTLRSDNKLNPDFDYFKSFKMANEIIGKEPDSKDTNSCYYILGDFYQSGVYRPKDIEKTITFYKKAYANSPGMRKLLSKRIAEFYLEQLNDYDNAEIWYKKAYELNKDEKYLHMVEQYKKMNPVYSKSLDVNSSKKQQVFPTLENFQNAKQIVSKLESIQYYFLATGQKSIKVFDKKTLKVSKELRGWMGMGMEGMVTSMVFDEQNHLLYAAPLYSATDFSKNDTILVFNIDTGKVLKTIKNKKAMKVTHMSISGDGKYLLAINGANIFNIINIETNQTQSYASFMSKAKLLMGTIEKKGDDYIVYILDSDKTLWGYSIKEERQISREVYKNQISFNIFNQTSSKAKAAAKKLFTGHHNNFTNFFYTEKKLYMKEHNSSNIRYFDLDTLKLKKSTTKIDFIDNASSNIELKYKNDYTTIEVVKKSTQKHLSTLDFLWVKPLKHVLIDDKYILVVSNDATMMFVFNLQGRVVANLRGIKSLQSELLHYKDGYLFSMGPDKVIHIWDLSKLDNIDVSKDVYDKNMLNGFNSLFGGNPLDILTETLDKDFLEQQAKQNNLSYVPIEKQFKFFMKTFMLKKKTIKPLASLYIKDCEWVLYNSKGLFASSENGKKLLKYHLNQGKYKEAKIVESEQIFEKFYRSDLMRKILAKEKVNVDIDIRFVLLNIKPPKVSIVQHSLKEKKNLTLVYKVCDQGSGVSNIRLVINGTEKVLKGTRGFTINKIIKKKDPCKVFEDIITLAPGQNSVVLKAYDAKQMISSSSPKVDVKADYTLKGKAKLFFVSIAVSDYALPSLKLKYPVKDVLAIEKRILQQSNNLFSDTEIHRLHDKDVTKAKLNELFEGISAKMNFNDVLILYLAGHGVTSSKDGLFYFLSYDSKSLDNVEDRGISVNMMKEQIGKLNTNKFLIMLDTCNSGSVIDHTIQSEDTVQRLSHGSNYNYIVASSSTQSALEGYKEHGVFTYSILDAFDNAYFPGDNVLTVSALAAYVEKMVPRITKKVFNYEQVPEKYLSGKDFEIGERQ